MIIFTLKELLNKHNMTQKELSEKTGIRLPTISDICNNKVKQFPVYAMDELCKTLNCEPKDFIKFISDNDAIRIENLKSQINLILEN